jgi:phage portal protein BeeE
VSRLTKLLDRGQVKASFGGTGQPFTQPAHWTRPLGSFWSPTTGPKEQIESSFTGYVEHAYKTNGVVFACVLARAMPFSEARFQFQHLHQGRPAGLFDSPSLRNLDEPLGPNTTTGELLWRMEQDVSMAGNSYYRIKGNRLRRMRPDWVTIVSGVLGDPEASAWDLESEVVGYIYEDKSKGYASSAVLLSPSEVVHYSVVPDPAAQWRGMSWLTPVLREIQADHEATEHKLNFFANGATLGMVISYDPAVKPDDVARYKALFDEGHRGTRNAYSALHLGGGADPKVMGVDMQQLDFKATQGAGETRIAAAAGVGAIIPGFSEGMQGSSLNSGNYQAAIRKFSDLTLRPLWRTAASALSKFTPPPANARLWYDVRDVALLHESASDEAAILATNAQSLKALVDAGYDPDAAVMAVDTGDISSLVSKHSGLYSVQLQPPGSNDPAVAAPADPADPAQERPLALLDQVNAATALIRAGFEPAAALSAVGLPPVPHTGFTPITVKPPEESP